MSILLEAAIDAIITEFTEPQLKALEANWNGEIISFKEELLVNNKRKTPKLTTENYSLCARRHIKTFKHMFDQKNMKIETREVFFGVFNKLFI